MKPAKSTKKKPAVVKPKTKLNLNLAYVDEIADESASTAMVLRALIHTMANEIESLRAQLEDVK